MNLPEHAIVLVRGGELLIFPGGKYFMVVRGKFDMTWGARDTENRGVSRYGVR